MKYAASGINLEKNNEKSNKAKKTEQYAGNLSFLQNLGRRNARYTQIANVSVVGLTGANSGDMCTSFWGILMA